MYRALFVPDQHVLELVLLEQLVIDIEDRAARIAEDVLDAFLLEAADHNFCARQLHGTPLGSINNHSRSACGPVPAICGELLRTRYGVVRVLPRLESGR